MIEIGDDWAISMDENCVTVLKRKVIKDEDSPNFGAESWENKWYYTDLTMALQSLIDRDLQSQITARLPNLVRRIEELKKYIDEAILEAFKEYPDHPLTKGYSEVRKKWHKKGWYK